MNYGKILKELREENQLTQEKLAEKLNIKRSLYNQYEHQYDVIPTFRLNDISNLFKVSIDYILGLADKKNYTNYNEKIDISKTTIRLKELRKENKLTQDKLAKELNSANTTISGYERGTRIIATPFLYEICKKYHISADYLLGKTDEPKYLN